MWRNCFLKELIAALQAALGDGTQAAAYIHKLIDLGILALRVPVPEDDSSGAQALCAFLASVPSTLAKTVCKSLLELESLRESFSHANHAGRVKIMPEMERLAAQTFDLMSPGNSTQWTGKLIYEDSAEEGISGADTQECFATAVGDLEQFLSWCSVLIDDNIFHQRTVSSILSDRLGGKTVSLLQFAQHWIQAISGQWQQPHVPLSGPELNPLDLDDLRRLLKLRAELGAVIAQSSGEDEIDLNAMAERYGWQSRSRALGFKASGTPWFSCYCQPLAAVEGSAPIVVNSIVAGPARPVVHVLSAFADPQDRIEVASELRAALEDACFPFEPCQLLATFDYNANLACRVTRRVINYVDDPSVPAAGEVRLGELDVRLEDGKAVLIHRSSQKRLVPLDCGMMAPALHPPVYRLLVFLGGIVDTPVRFFEPYLWRDDDNQPAKLEFFPRIKAGACILRRRGWSVPAESLPRRQPRESDSQYFVRVRRWQKDLGLPDEVFVRATSLLEWKDQAQRSQDRQTWNRRKPQYVNFRNFFLVDVLEKLIQETRKRLYLEEFLPDRRSWEHWRLRRPVEFIVDVGAR